MGEVMGWWAWLRGSGFEGSPMIGQEGSAVVVADFTRLGDYRIPTITRAHQEVRC